MGKTTRVTHKIFGSGASAAVNGVAQFGSKQAGTPNYTTDIATMQALAAWIQGWSGAVVSGKVPPLEELNAAFLEPSYQIGYLLEMGIPEYDAGTVYFQNSICQSNGVLYQSRFDFNLNNPVTDTSKWQIFSLNTAKGENLFRNAGMEVAQRGPSGTITAGSPAYTTDGWIVGSTGANITWGTTYASNLSITGAAGVTDAFIKQRIESNVCAGALLDGDYLTFQCLIGNYSGSPLVPVLSIGSPLTSDFYGSGTTVILSPVNLQAVANNTSAVVSFTFKLPTLSTYYQGLEVILDFGGVLNGVGNNVMVSRFDISRTPNLTSTGLQSRPPEPQIRPIGVEMPFCRRYLRVWGGGNDTGTPQLMGVAYSTTKMLIFITFDTPMFIHAVDPGNGIHYSALSDWAVISIGGSTIGTPTNIQQPFFGDKSGSIGFEVDVASGLTSGTWYILGGNASVSIPSIYFSSEI